MAFSNLGLAKVRDEMAGSLSHMARELLPALDVFGRKLGIRIECHVDHITDTLMIRARFPTGEQFIERITRYEIEDGNHIAKLRFIMDTLMCASKGSIPVTAGQLEQAAQYQKILSQQPNQYLQEMNGLNYKPKPIQQAAPRIKPDPVIPPEPTVEDLRKRMERKIDISD